MQAQQFERILLASEGRSITNAAIDRVAELTSPSGASVHVFTLARVHGVAFGLQTPGLLPSKSEWEGQREIVNRAIKRLKRKGIAATGHVVGTRKSTSRIIKEAREHDSEAIVMAADPDRNRIIGNMLWSQEPQRVRRRAKLPVFLVVE